MVCGELIIRHDDMCEEVARISIYSIHSDSVLCDRTLLFVIGMWRVFWMIINGFARPHHHDVFSEYVGALKQKGSALGPFVTCFSVVRFHSFRLFLCL